MSYIKICAFSILTSALLLLISNREKELSSTISITVFLSVMIYTVTRVNEVLKWFIPYIQSISIIDSEILIKILGLSILSFVSVSICESIGQKGISLSIEILTTIEILSVIYPTIKSLTESALKILNGQYLF